MISGEEPTSMIFYILILHFQLTTFNPHINQGGLHLNLISTDYTLVESNILNINDSGVRKLLLWTSNLSPSIRNKTMTSRDAEE
jgi:hypothetical protein